MLRGVEGCGGVWRGGVISEVCLGFQCFDLQVKVGQGGEVSMHIHIYIYICTYIYTQRHI